MDNVYWSAHTIKIGELSAKVLAIDDSYNKPQPLDSKPLAKALNTIHEVQRESLATQTEETKRTSALQRSQLQILYTARAYE